jgi:hypothetical protein
VAARKASLEQSARRDAIEAELVRSRVMENQRHAAAMQHAINGANANALQAQSNAIQAERNRVMAEANIALQRARGILICDRCGAYGHYTCGR